MQFNKIVYQKTSYRYIRLNIMSLILWIKLCKETLITNLNKYCVKHLLRKKILFTNLFNMHNINIQVVN